MSLLLTRRRGAHRFTPDMLTGLHTWYDASKEAFTDNDAVGQVTDWSGNGHHATQTTAGKKPTFKTAGINGKPAFQFVSANAQTVFSSAFTSLPQPYTIFILSTTTASQQTVANNAAGIQFLFGSSASFVRMACATFITSSIAPSSTAAIWRCECNGASSTLSQNGTPIAAGNAGTSALTALRLGANNTDTVWFDGYIAAVILYNRLLTVDEQALVRGYLA